MTEVGTWNPMRQQYDKPQSLADFLLERIAEDEQTVRVTTNNGRLTAIGGVIAEAAGDVYSADRLLAECEAKRRIVEEYRTFTDPDPDDGIPQYADDAAEDRLWPEYGGGMFAGLRLAARALALPYADHPDYRDEWRP